MSTASALREGERRTLAAVCDAFMPSLAPRAGDDAILFRTSAVDIGLAEAVERAIVGGALSTQRSRELRFFLRLLDSAVFMLVVTGRFAGFASMSASEREAALLRMAKSPIPAVRTGFQALKRLATFLAYAATPDGVSNAMWPSLGYELPPAVPRTTAPKLMLWRPPRTMRLDVDACVIGAGAGGAVVAERLASAGLEVVVLEAGPGDQAADYDRREIAATQRLYLDQGTTATRDLGVAILAGRSLGGGTTVNWQTSLRLPDEVRDEWAERSGMGAFTDARFTSALDAVCARLSVGTGETVRNANNETLARGCSALGYHWSEIPRNSRGCDQAQCGYCVFGCSVGGKQTAATTFLADAQRSGLVTIVPGSWVEYVARAGGAASGAFAYVTDSAGGVTHLAVHAPIVVVAAGAIETPALLLRSRIRHPQLGRNLFLHPTSAVAGRYAKPIRGWLGAPQSVLCDELASLSGAYGVRLETSPVHPGLMALAQPWHGGQSHRERMQQLANVSALIVLSRDRNSGRVTIDRDGRPVIDYRLGKLEHSLLQRGIAAAARVHWAAGAEEIHTLHTREQSLRRSSATTPRDIDAFCERIATLPVNANHCAVFSAHQMGTCRMGTDPRRDVCDENGQVYGVPRLFVADGSLFPASSGVNPMITIMALAHMVGDGIAARPGR